jgi:uncharacterized protein
MTTNALLLNKHIEFLVENNFLLLISLDGNEKNNSYRLDKKGHSSFSKVIKNVDELHLHHRTFFENNVNFNAVLNDKNSISEIYTFIKNRYGKVPQISELNSIGIRPEMHSLFKKTYKSINNSLSKSKNVNELCSNMFMNLPQYKSIVRLIHFYSGFVYKSYNDFFRNRGEQIFLPTGTCLPLSKKIFLTVNNKILPCERIGHQYVLGSIYKDTVKLNFEEISDKFNEYYDKLNSQCSICYHASVCIQCIFNLENLYGNPKCQGFMTERIVSTYFSENFSFLEDHPSDYHRIMDEVIME